MSKRRIVVTGLGMVSPVGNTVEESWKNIVAGKSGIGVLDTFDTTDFPIKIHGGLKDFDATLYLPKKDLKKMDLFIHYGLAAGLQALDDSGLEVTEENAPMIGVAIGSGIGGLPYIERNRDLYVKGGARKISPFFVPGSIVNMVSGNLSIMRGLQGPNISIVSACTTGTHNIGDAARMIAYGDADVMVAGGAEMASSALGIGGFAAARALSKRNDDPEAASRPWDVDRDGFVLGDGAGVVVLEEYEHAKARGAKIYCELAGYGMSGDAYHMTSPSISGEGAARCMNNALNDAGMNKEDIDYINAHGTSTPAGDVAEINGIKRAMGDHANDLIVSSTKSMIGHLLGAAGGVESIFAILALRDQVVPPTINLDNQDPDCDLDLCANVARETKLDVTMSNNFGFGGTNGTLIYKKI
ncbi:MAG: beta-ketoacyl-ACP synthase II [Gammaproteobacteria bacterium]|nr:beta-ketoacyl-ACP synthase II [Gammaproteobacteria bacterium]